MKVVIFYLLIFSSVAKANYSSEVYLVLCKQQYKDFENKLRMEQDQDKRLSMFFLYSSLKSDSAPEVEVPSADYIKEVEVVQDVLSKIDRRFEDLSQMLSMLNFNSKNPVIEEYREELELVLRDLNEEEISLAEHYKTKYKDSNWAVDPFLYYQLLSYLGNDSPDILERISKGIDKIPPGHPLKNSLMGLMEENKTLGFNNVVIGYYKDAYKNCPNDMHIASDYLYALIQTGAYEEAKKIVSEQISIRKNYHPIFDAYAANVHFSVGESAKSVIYAKRVIESGHLLNKAWVEQSQDIINRSQLTTNASQLPFYLIGLLSAGSILVGLVTFMKRKKE